MRQLSSYELASVNGQKNVISVECGEYSVPLLSRSAMKKMIDKAVMPAALMLTSLAGLKASSDPKAQGSNKACVLGAGMSLCFIGLVADDFIDYVYDELELP